MGKTAAIIQTRMGSTRLPGKVMLGLSGRPVLWHVVDRVKRCTMLDDIIIATTTKKEDNIIEAFCEKEQISIYRGDAQDVLSRYVEAAEQFKVDIIVRITSDCPLYDPTIMQAMLQQFDADYMSSRLHSYTFPRGLDTEIVTLDVLKRTQKLATQDYEKEHVTPYIYEHPTAYKLKSFESPENNSHHRWTLDTKEDYAMIKTVYDALYPTNPAFTTNDVLDYLDHHPEVFELNAHIKQKSMTG